MLKGRDNPACISNYLEMEKTIDLSNWNSTIDKIGRDINILLKGLSTHNIVGYGAPAKVTTFLYKFGINKSMIRYIIDDNPLKQYKYTPGLHIPVLPYNPNDKIDYIIIFAWNFAEEIIQKIKNIGCRIIIPFPEIRII